VNRILLVLVMLTATAGAVVAYGDPQQIARASQSVQHILWQRHEAAAPAVQIPRGQGGEFALRAKINGVTTPMVIDTGATSVVLTWETAKAIGLPLEMLEYDVDVETVGGHTRRHGDSIAPSANSSRNQFGVGGAARADEDQPARHEFSRSAGKLGRPRRHADAARLPQRIRPPTSRPHGRQLSAIASRSTFTPRPPPCSAR
jgi:hypothetical protein